MPPRLFGARRRPARLNPYDLMGLVPDADAKPPPATGPRLSGADAWKAVAKPPGAGAAPKPAWGLDADLAAYCDDYIRLASGRLDDPKVKGLYDQAVADKPKLLEAYREAVFQKRRGRARARGGQAAA